MAILASKFVTGVLPTTTADSANDVVTNDYFFDITAAQLVLNNIIDIGILPAYHTVVDAILIPDDIDSASSAALDVGIMSGTPGDTVTARTCGSEIFAAETGCRTGAIARASQKSAFIILPTDADRSIGVKIQAAPGTPVAGRIRVRVLMKAGDHKVQF